MEKYRAIKKLGGSWYIKLAPIDIKDFQLSLGDEVDISEMMKKYIQNKNISLKKKDIKK